MNKRRNTCDRFFATEQIKYLVPNFSNQSLQVEQRRPIITVLSKKAVVHKKDVAIHPTQSCLSPCQLLCCLTRDETAVKLTAKRCNRNTMTVCHILLAVKTRSDKTNVLSLTICHRMNKILLQHSHQANHILPIY